MYKPVRKVFYIPIFGTRESKNFNRSYCGIQTSAIRPSAVTINRGFYDDKPYRPQQEIVTFYTRSPVSGSESCVF